MCSGVDASIKTGSDGCAETGDSTDGSTIVSAGIVGVG
jgi:hypothetical protein